MINPNLFFSMQGNPSQEPEPGPSPDVPRPSKPTPGTPQPGDPPGKKSQPADPPPSQPKPTPPGPVEPKSGIGLVDPRDLLGDHDKPFPLSEEPPDVGSHRASQDAAKPRRKE